MFTWQCAFRIVLLLILSSVGVLHSSLAQEADQVEDPAAWKKDLIGKLAGSQAGFQNWAEGGVNTLAFSSGLDGAAERTSGGWHQKYQSRLAFGLVKQDTSDVRKAEDMIRLQATFQHLGTGSLDKFSPTVALTARSQFVAGFNYEKNPFEETKALPIKVSDFLSPGTFSQAVGMTYQHSEYLSQRLGVGGKQTVVLDEELRELYSLDADQTVRVEFGIEAYTEYQKEIFTNVNVKSTLGLFASFNKPDSPDMFWETQVGMKVNSWLQVNFEWGVLYDEDVSKNVQLKEIFSVGVSYQFL